MNSNHIRLSQWKRKILANSSIRNHYENQQPSMLLVRELVEQRINNKLSQAELAKKIGTTQSVISRLESGKANPSMVILQRLAKAFNTKLEIKFQPI